MGKVVNMKTATMFRAFVLLIAVVIIYLLNVRSRSRNFDKYGSKLDSLAYLLNSEYIDNQQGFAIADGYLIINQNSDIKSVWALTNFWLKIGTNRVFISGDVVLARKTSEGIEISIAGKAKAQVGIRRTQSVLP